MSDVFHLAPGLRISATGLEAEAKRLEVIAGNIANANTTIPPNGPAIRRKQVVFSATLAKSLQPGFSSDRFSGVQVRGIIEDPRPPKRVHRPGHPDADADGYVTMPHINALEEMVDLLSAMRAYEANLAAQKASRAMAQQALGIGKP